MLLVYLLVKVSIFVILSLVIPSLLLLENTVSCFFFFCIEQSGYNIFKNIVHSIPVQEFTIQDPDDVKFFVRAMDLAKKYSCKDVGEKIHNILLTGNNYKCINCSAYVRCFFSIIHEIYLLITLFI